MLSAEDNLALSRVGRGTLMGDLLREYWLPALLSSEVSAADSEPVRVKLLGEELIAFRDTSCKVGLLQNHCPHRGASLFFGRNEEAGLRCVYHGWKFSPDGTCVDMPNEPAESDFRTKVRALGLSNAAFFACWQPVRPAAGRARRRRYSIVMTPTGVLGLEKRFRAWVPMDDEHTLAITVGAPGARAMGNAKFHPRGTSWYDRFRPQDGLANDYHVDRALQRRNSGPGGYTGMTSGYMQDQMITESMGALVDRSAERLGSSDAMIIRTRRRLLEAARSLRSAGVVPVGVDDPSVYAVRSGGVELPRSANWLAATESLRRAPRG